MNYEHPVPRVSGYQRVCDIMEVDITETKDGVLGTKWDTHKSVNGDLINVKSFLREVP